MIAFVIHIYPSLIGLIMSYIILIQGYVVVLTFIIASVMIVRLGRGWRSVRRQTFSFSNEIQEFTDQELKTAQKYVEETLRNRSWILHMFGSYFPGPLKAPYFAIQLFDLELTKISENAREAPLGIRFFIQRWANWIFGRKLCSKYITGKSLSLNPYPFACTMP